MTPLRSVSRWPTRHEALLVIFLTERTVLVRPPSGFLLFAYAPTTTTLALRLPLALGSRHLHPRACRCFAHPTIGRASPTR
jgi:hypothetical protein